MKKTLLFKVLPFVVLTLVLIAVFLIPVITANSAKTATASNNEAKIENTENASGDASLVPLSQNGTADKNIENSSGTIMNIYKESNESDSITIFWDSVENATGYKVYFQRMDESDEYEFLGTVKDTTYTVSDLPSSSRFSFKVTPVFDFGALLVEGEPTVLNTATHPDTVGAIRLKKSAFTIGFAFSQVEHASAYEIYRMCYKNKGEYELYDTITDNSITEYEDKNVEDGRSYYYKVRAILKTENDTEYFGEFSDFKAVCGLYAPKLNSVTTQLRRVSFNWSKSKYADGYDIYYSKTPDNGFQLLGTTTDLYFNSPRLEAGTKYYFRLAPYSLVGDNKVKIIGSWDSVAETPTKEAFSVDCGDTYIEVSREQQRLWYYIDGELFETTPVVTGNFGSMDTPKGCYKIFQRTAPATLRGPGYVSYVNYWLGFTTSGCGIHDANWRSGGEYGGRTYVGNGSHGCVNTPIESVKKIYDKATIGTYVVVY